MVKREEFLSQLKKYPNLKEFFQQAEKEIDKAASLEGLEKIRVKYLGRKGKITEILRRVGKLPPAERPILGKLSNEVRIKSEREIRLKREQLEKQATESKLLAEKIDITLPGKRRPVGKKHPITEVIEELIEIFLGLGYKVAEGPEVELDWYNFDALNTPPDHPARAMTDTFYIDENILLRTHTSPVQIRVMEKNKPPLYIISPGKCYRHDVMDPTHSPMFHQIEGFIVDKNITFGDLKGTLEVFARSFFGKDRKIRLRAHFFPFTEPSAEMDVSCGACKGSGCRICSYKGWIEILGCGMIDPFVFETVGYDPEEYTGFAFGGGVERMAILKYGINDIRLFFENDLRFLKP